MRATKILLGLALSFASVANAQFHLQEVQVISQQTEIHSQAYRLVKEISKETIAALPATNVVDLLQTLPGRCYPRRFRFGALYA